MNALGTFVLGVLDLVPLVQDDVILSDQIKEVQVVNLGNSYRQKSSAYPSESPAIIGLAQLTGVVD